MIRTSLLAALAISTLTMTERDYDTMAWSPPARRPSSAAKPKHKPKYKGSKAAKKASRRRRP